MKTWADAFKGVPELREVEKQYFELKKKGIEFPMTDLDKMAPIHTPARVGGEKHYFILFIHFQPNVSLFLSFTE